MILSDVTIAEYLASGKIRVMPAVAPGDIRPTGIRLHLAEDILVPAAPGVVDLREPIAPEFDRVHIAAGFTLRPGAFVLASTRERVQAVAPLVGLLDGRSTLARLGLVVHAGSSIIDSNHDEPRSIVLEIKNIGPYDLILWPGLPIAMIAFSMLTHPIRQPSQRQYAGQDAVQPPNLADTTMGRTDE